MTLKSLNIIENCSTTDEKLIYTYNGWIQDNKRIVWYIDTNDRLLIMADVKNYKGNNTYETPFLNCYYDDHSSWRSVQRRRFKAVYRST